TIDPGHNLGYPFMIDFLAATLDVTGQALTSGLVITSAFLGVVFVPVLYLVAARLAGGRLAAGLASAVFICSGGFGFLLVIQDLAQHGLAFATVRTYEYTLNRELFNDQWLNPVLAYLVPQRSVLLGFTVALILVLVLYRAAGASDRRPFLFAGLVAGVLPWFHVYAYGTVVALGGIWFLMHPRRVWLWFGVPALVFGVPAVLWLLPGGG